jgi:hypothetical protein
MNFRNFNEIILFVFMYLRIWFLDFRYDSVPSVVNFFLSKFGLGVNL